MANQRKPVAAGKAATAPAKPATTDVSAVIAALPPEVLAALGLSAPKVETPKAQPTQSPETWAAAKVADGIAAVGGKVVRAGKSGLTPSGNPKSWVDIAFVTAEGTLRVQCNAFLVAKTK